MKAFIAFVFVILGAIGLLLFYCSSMPGASIPPSLAPLTDEEQDVSGRLKDVCEQLGHRIGQRSTIKTQAVADAREFIHQRLSRAGLRPKEMTFSSRGELGVNLVSEIEGTGAREEILVLGAHYDTASYTPGANDNASGVAMLLEIGRLIGERPRDRTIQIVFFDRGSTRFAGSEASGSHAFAADAKKQNRKVVAMISLDSVGIYLDQADTQRGPFPLSLFYPRTGNFLLFASDTGSRELVQACVGNFRSQGAVACEGLTLPPLLPWLSHSDHHAFRQQGWPSMLVTDTGPLRNTEHGQMTDTPDRLNYHRMAQATVRLARVIEKLAQRQSPGTASLH